MISVRLVLGEEIAAELNSFGCEKIPDANLIDHGVWKTPWGHHFIVPEIGPERACVYSDYKDIIKQQIRKTKPKPS